MSVITAAQAGGQNRVAALDMVAWSEIGPALLAASDNGYNVLVGSTPEKPLLFTSYARYPDIMNHEFDSTAAGRYQEVNRNWIYYSHLLHLSDFSPMSQDLIALQQMKEAGALPLLDAGNFKAALMKIGHLWASLPNNNYGQHQNVIANLQLAYTNAGGTLA